MFLKIFSFELKYWFQNPLLYVYSGILFLVGLLAMAASAGIFSGSTATITSITTVNSAIAIHAFTDAFTTLAFFFLPSIIGGTVNKDFSTNTSNVLYSYPFSKVDYLFGKYLSSMVIAVLVLSFVGLGMMIGGYLPGTNPDLLGPFRLMNFIEPYLYFIIPNLIFVGSIIFSVVIFSRNIAAGFIVAIILFFAHDLAGILVDNLDNETLGLMIDPFGNTALRHYTEYWTAFEQNENTLPFEGYVLWNRVLWTAVGILIFAAVYFLFSFTHNPLSFSWKKKKGERLIKNNFGSMIRLNLPKVQFKYDFLNYVKSAWLTSNVEFRFVATSWPFIIITLMGLLFLVVFLLISGEIFGTQTYPVTWQMLQFSGGLFQTLALLPITYLYTGILIHRSRTAKMDQLVDITPAPNWTLLLSKFLAILKIQVVMLLVIMVSGIIIQSVSGYYKFEIGLYLQELLSIRLINLVIWSLLAVLVQTMIPNYIFGFIVTLAIGIGISFLDQIGVEQSIFKFNEGPGFSYSDMNGYGSSLINYFLYKFYWLALGIVFYIIGIAFWKRGVSRGIAYRWSEGLKGFNLPLILGISVAFIAFLSFGGWRYYENNVKVERVSSKKREENQVKWEELYGKYDGIAQPRIVDVKINVDLVPESRDFKVKGVFTIKNKSDEVVDSLHLNHNNYPSEFSFDRGYDLVLEDTVFNYDIYKLDQPLQPGETMSFTFEMWNKPNKILDNNSPVISNGTFINNGIFPSFGYSPAGEIRNNKIREKYGLAPKERMMSPYDSASMKNTYISSTADWIDFETTVSTSPDQIAIAPGYLQREWEENGRRYFHYKMDSKMLNFYAFQSARYEVLKDQWNDINIEIYYHKGHEYNLDRMIKGIKKSLDYYTKNFSPYQHKQVRIIEFPRTGGGFAQSFANTIPYSEAIGFIAKVDDDDDSGVDYPFSVTAHEVAHQWWAHQVIGANAQGATVMSESLSEYSSLKVLEKEYGSDKMRVFLKDALDSYLTGRTLESQKEKPLMFNENQQYIHYNKGSLVLYALSDYIGESVMNKALSEYVDSVAFQEAPYTTSVEFVSFMQQATPDSLQYLINDMFETITLYDNSVKESSYKKLDNGKYEVSISSIVTKYKANEKGKRVFKDAVGDSLTYQVEGKRKPMQSLPLSDWIDVGVFVKKEVDGKNKEVPIYLKKHQFTEIDNELKIIVDEKPDFVGVDPYNKLIDTNSNDNRSFPKEETE